MRISPFARAALVLAPLVVLSAPAAGEVVLEVSPSAEGISTCPGSRLSVTVTLRNPDSVPVAGYQVFIRYPAQFFEPVDFRPASFDGHLQVAGPPPLGDGFRQCAGEDGWSDGAGDDVVGVVATVFGHGGAGPFIGESIELGSFTFQPRGEPTGAELPTFSPIEDPCLPFLDQAPRAFGPEGLALETTPPAPFAVAVGDAGPSLQAFSCTDLGETVLLQWVPPDAEFTGYRIYRDFEGLFVFPLKSVQSYEDSSPPEGRVLYEIALILRGGGEGCRTSCVVERGSGVRFLRGDANRDGNLNLSDAVAVLDHLFGGRVTTCLDAADFDDTGIVNLTDSVAILQYLFVPGSGAPPPPFPEPGVDLTEDALGCES